MVKSGKKRIDKYKAKLDPGHIGKSYDRTKKLAVDLETKYFQEAVELQNKVKVIVSDQPTILHHFYMDYAEELKKKPQENERFIIFEKWDRRGLDYCILIKIAKNLFNFILPADRMFEFYNENDNAELEIYGVRWWAQTITIGNTGPNVNHIITSVKLKLYREGLPGDLTISIQGLNGADKPDGVDLSIGTTDGNTLPVGAPYEWREISMTPYTLEAGKKYAIVCRALTGSGLNSVWWRRDFEDPEYTGGQAAYSFNSGVDWTLSSINDFMFEVWSKCPV